MKRFVLVLTAAIFAFQSVSCSYRRGVLIEKPSARKTPKLYDRNGWQIVSFTTRDGATHPFRGFVKLAPGD